MFYKEGCHGCNMPARDDIDIDINVDQNMGMNVGMNPAMPMAPAMMPSMGYGSGFCPIIEAPQQRIVQRQFVHEVPHVCPINTKVINQHVYKHTYSPHYSCCEENQACHISEGSCCNFR